VTVRSADPLNIVQTVHHPVSAKSFVEPVVAYLQARGYETFLWVQPQRGAERFAESLSVKYESISSDLHVNPVSDAVRLQRLRERIRLVKPTVVHCHQTRASFLPLLAARLENVTVRVYHNHGLSYVAHSGIVRLLLRMIEQLNIQLATHVLFVSESTLHRAQADGLLTGKHAGVPGPGTIAGINLDHFPLNGTSTEAKTAARRALGLPTYAFIVGYVGRPVRHKGFPQILAGWRDSRLFQDGSVLIMAGCKPDDVSRMAEGGVHGVKAYGYQEDMLRFYAACDVLALPSQTEGFPYAVLEASAAARPSVATDVLGNRDAIEHGRGGLLIPVDDSRALAEALVRLRREPELRLRMGRAARETVERKYAREKVLGALLEYYDRHLLGGLRLGEQTARAALSPAAV
jgi:glycosyltransferase involved in cell wall biosynthesis